VPEHDAGATNGAKAQRLRIRFGRGPEAAAVGHLDMTRIWVEALGSAGVVLSYSQGSRPQPRVTMAAGLPMGVTSEGELLDAITAEVVETAALSVRLEPELPEGLTVLGVSEVGMGLPSLPSAVRWADYEVDIDANGENVPKAVADLLAADTLPWVDRRGEKTRRYDLRPLVGDVMVMEPCTDTVRLTMRLRCGPDGVGRADQVAKALGLPDPVRVHRRRLLLADESRARVAWRRRGRYL